MRKTFAAFAISVLALAGCGTIGEDEATVTNTPVATSSSATTSSATTLPSDTETSGESPSEEAASPVEPAADANQQGPQIASCATDPTLYERGTTWFTDGTSGWTQQCADQMPAVAPDLSDIPFADGGTCPAYKCGYGHDANGNPNPTSGELQTQHGCEQGYITDTALCGAVNEKIGAY